MLKYKLTHITINWYMYRFPWYHSEHKIILTTEFLCSSTTNKSLKHTNLSPPPNITAFLPPSDVRVKLEHEGGGCPVTVGELHLPEGDYIISHYYRRGNFTHQYSEKTCAAHWCG